MSRAGGASPRLLEGLPPAFRWLLAGTFASSLATFVFPFLALFLTGQGFTASQAGLVAGLWGGGSIVSGPLAGLCADRLGRRPTLIASLVTTALLTALLAAVKAPLALAAVTALLGVVMSAWRPAASALVADEVAPEHRGRAFGLMHWVNNIGIAVSLAVGGVLAVHGFRPLFLADAATTLLFAAVVLTRIPETRPVAPPPQAGPASPRRGYPAVLADRHLLALLALLLLILLPFCQFMAAVPLALTGQGHSTAVFGAVMAVNGTVIGLFQPTLSRRAARHDPGRVLALATALVGLGYGAYAVAGTPLAWGAATAVWSLGEILLWPCYEALISALAPPDLRGRYQGLTSLCFGVGLAASPPLGGLVLERLGPTTLWVGCLAVSWAVALGHLAAAGPRRRALATRVEVGV